MDAYNWLINRWLDYLLVLEGGYVNHKNDLGGETKYGITIATFNTAKKLAFTSRPLTELIELTHASAIEIYRKLYVIPTLNALRILNVRYTPSAIIHLLDISVNSGLKKSIQFAKICSNNDNQVTRNEISLKRKEWYKEIVRHNKSQKVFLLGWMHRIENLNAWLKRQGQNA